VWLCDLNIVVELGLIELIKVVVEVGIGVLFMSCLSME